MDNIGPIVLFILYMGISAWAKKNKAQQRVARDKNPGEGESESTFSENKPIMGGIFEQLKKELFDLEDTAPVVPFEEPMHQPEIETVQADIPTPQFTEGSDAFSTDAIYDVSMSAGKPENIQNLETVLESYSKIEQGILLHEILGKPRAFQDNKDWFHSS